MKKIIFVLSLMLSLSSCDNAKKEEPQTKPVVKVGVLYPMSGDGAFFGDSAKKAAGRTPVGFEKPMSAMEVALA